jgi:hypothetical protein
MDTIVSSPPAATAEHGHPHRSLWLLRATLTLYLLGVLAQPVLAGMFLTGDVDAISVHAAIGTALEAMTMLVVGATVLYVVGGHGRLWVLPVTVVLFFVVGLQIGMGYTRQLQIHIPLGVAIVTASVMLAVWAWSPSAARSRDNR